MFVPRIYFPSCCSLIKWWIIVYFCIFYKFRFARSENYTSKITCDVFCNDDILKQILLSNVLNHSGRKFVDLKLKLTPPQVVENFKILMNKTSGKPNEQQLQTFLSKNFEDPGNFLSKWTPDDWVPKPKFVSDIYDLKLKKWMIDVNAIWKELGREYSNDVKVNNSLYSFIYVPHPFIAPGSKFITFYYWDSYWIIEGLIASDMLQTAKNMILNLISMVDQLGYVPNGGRKYYLGRSQPPMLIPMCLLYWKATKNLTFLNSSINSLEKEFNFWVKHRSLDVQKDGLHYKVFQYRASVNQKKSKIGPRPESYYRDLTIAQTLNKSDRAQFFADIRAAAESGWDFSSRWFFGNLTNLSTIATESVIPVDLNSIIGYNAHILAMFFGILNNESKSAYYESIAYNMNRTISRLFWNNELGIWTDYNIKTNSCNPGFYLSNFVPLWTEMYGTEYEKAYIVRRVLEYINKESINSYVGGIPTSKINSSQQWDLPNAWAPLQYFLIFGLEKAKHIEHKAGDLAFEIAKKWVLNNYFGFENHNLMFEKYDVTNLGQPGGGGEYKIDTGFGWTNGVAIKLMSVYRHRIRVDEFYDPLPLAIGLLLALISIVTIICYAYKIDCCIFLKKRLLKKKKTYSHFDFFDDDYS